MSVARRVLVINHTDQTSGAEFVTLSLFRDNPSFRAILAAPEGPFTEAFGRQGHDVILAPELFHHPRVKGGRLWYLGLPYRLIKASVKVRRAVNRARPDLLMAISGISLLYTYGLRSAPPLVWMCHEIYGPHLGMTRLVPYVGQRAARVIVVSEAGRARLCELGLPKERIAVVPNAVDASESFNPSKVTPAELPDSTGRIRVGILGRIQPLKGLHVVLDAIERMPDRSRVALYVVGAGWPGMERYEEKLRAWAARLGPAKVFFLGWRADIPQVLAALDLVLAPAVEPEAFGLSALEALAMGKTVLASRIGGLVEFIRHGETGYLFTPGNAEELASLWWGVMTGAVPTTGGAGRRTVLESYTLGPWKKRLTELLLDL